MGKAQDDLLVKQALNNLGQRAQTFNMIRLVKQGQGPDGTDVVEEYPTDVFISLQLQGIAQLMEQLINVLVTVNADKFPVPSAEPVGVDYSDDQFKYSDDGLEDDGTDGHESLQHNTTHLGEKSEDIKSIALPREG